MREYAPAVPSTQVAEAREVLRQLVTFLNKGHEGAQAVWDIVTALRGPDSSRVTSLLKDITTTKIRYAVGLRAPYHSAGGGHLNGASIGSQNPPREFDSDNNLYDELSRRDISMEHVDGHFIYHTTSAVQALDELGFLTEDSNAPTVQEPAAA